MSGFAPVDEQMRILSRGAVEILPEEEFRERLEASRASATPLRIKASSIRSSPAGSRLTSMNWCSLSAWASRARWVYGQVGLP